jgi:hypothetical protein
MIMANGYVFVTFSVSRRFQNDEKFAVKCENIDKAKEVANDAYSIDGIKNVRIRECGKPRDRECMSYDNYWEYDEWF